MNDVSDTRTDLCVLIPCYNEEEVLPLFYEQITRVLSRESFSYELLFINDGSSDRTEDLLLKLSEQDTHVKYISFSRNFGKEAAMYAGFCNHSGRYVALMDADLQDPPEMLPDLLRKVREEGYDCAAARRMDRKGEPVLRSWLSDAFYSLINLVSDTKIDAGIRDFRVMRAEMADAVVRMSEYNRFSKGIFSWIGFRTCTLPYTNQERAAGETKWSFFSLFRYAADGILSFSQTPLAAVSWFGLIMTAVSFLALIFIVTRKLLFGDPVAGWASTICVIIFIGGLQLFCLGIIGQYIAKMYLETKQRPHYIAKKSNIKNYRNMM